MEINAFKHKSPNFKKLAEYGFNERNGSLEYVTRILDGQFELKVTVGRDKSVRTEVIDLADGEPYTLYLVAEASGAFVGRVREEVEQALDGIADKCFYRDVFKESQAHAVIEYARERYGDELEFLWEKTPDCAVWRRKDNKKWYGALLTISKSKLGLDCDERVTVIDLRLDLDKADIVDGKRIFKGYHMNKRTWFTICLDGTVPTNEIFYYIDKSYELAKK